MERKKTFGQEVKSLRRQLGWSQKELAYNISDISPRTLGKIERGEKPFVNHSMVTQLANALHLEALAREEFFSLAGLNEGSHSDGYEPPQADPAAIDLYYRSIRIPAYIHDSFLSLHSINSSMLAVFGLDVEDYRLEMFDSSGPHILRTLFEMQFESRTNWTKDKDWRIHAEMLVYRFRLMTRKFTDNPKYIDLLDDLKKMPEFKEIWRKTEQNDYVPNFPLLNTFHLRTGEELQFITAVATDTAFIATGDNKVMFVPADETTKNFLTRVWNETPRFYLRFDQTAPRGYEKVML